MYIAVEKLNAIEYRKIQRYRLGLTQAQLAKKLGFSTDFYQLWETGKRNSKRLDAAFKALVEKSNRRNRPSSFNFGKSYGAR